MVVLNREAVSDYLKRTFPELNPADAFSIFKRVMDTMEDIKIQLTDSDLAAINGGQLIRKEIKIDGLPAAMSIGILNNLSTNTPGGNDKYPK